MAGIIAGRDDGAPAVIQKGNEDHFLGMAPDARVVSVKLADASGATDVSQVIAGIDWVVQNRNRNGLNIRVLNLSFGTDGVQSYLVDPLTYAAEVAWRKGIVVVVSAGNEGYGSAKLNNPAYDPHVLAVGGADGAGTYDYKDDTIQSWSSRGDGTRNPDLVAPGASILSLRNPGSTIDTEASTARVATRFFKGTGTSQAAAVVSGAAALVIQQRPTITPDQVKRLLTNGAQRLQKADPVAQGKGMMDLKFVRDQPTPTVTAAGPELRLLDRHRVAGGQPRHHPQPERGRGQPDRRDRRLRRRLGRPALVRPDLDRHHLDRRQLHGIGLHRWHLERPDVVGAALVQRLLDRAQVVRQRLDRRDLDRPDVVGQRLVRPQMVRRGVDVARGHDDHAAAPGIPRGGRRFRWASDLAIQGVWERTGWGRWP